MCIVRKGERVTARPDVNPPKKKDVKVPFFKKNYLLSFHSSSSKERGMKEDIFIYLFIIIIITKMIKGNADPLK